jgi:FAD/FMN-containing dehydrogenase
VRASSTSEPELFWGLRGGGGNFGIVTRFEFQAHPLGPEVFAGALIYRRPRWAEALRAFTAWTADIPDELSPITTFIAPPPSWELGSETLMMIGFAWAGAEGAAGASAVEPLRRACPADIEVLEPTTWLVWQSSVDEVFPDGVRAYWKNATLDSLGDGLVETIVEWAARLPASRSGFDIHAMGGAIGRVAEDATAFPNRSARYLVNMYGVWDDPADDARGRAWARGFHAALSAHAALGQYVNFLGLDAAAGSPIEAARRAARRAALEAYGPDKLARLTALKDRFDPDNVFHLNHNIPPSR